MATSHPPTHTHTHTHSRANLCLALGSSSNSICSNHNSTRTAITAHRTANFASKKFPLMLLRLRLCSVPSWDLCLPLVLSLFCLPSPSRQSPLSHYPYPAIS